jgi:GH15 family glucan-1,4-alpha-glucosidase
MGQTTVLRKERDQRADANRERRRLEHRYPPIEAHGVIGDLQTVALVSLHAGIDFFCVPSFDSPTVFARLLDADQGGAFDINPQLTGVSHKQLYLPDTNVLLTRFLAEEAVVEVSDFMPIPRKVQPTRIVRRVKAVRGDATIRVRCAPRFDYARLGHTIEIGKGVATMRCEDGSITLRLLSPCPLERDGDDVVCEFRLAAGESVAFVLEHAVAGVSPVVPDRASVAKAFKATVNFWRRWIGHSTYRGRWRHEVNRSALALKLLQCRHTGAFIAAPTFGLPETIGGKRNWDYRYTWIRDASFILYALIRLGMTDETKSFIDWLVQRTEEAESPGQLQTIYGIDGRTKLPEQTLDHLEGYRGSRPVRVGNAAYDQVQLDIYGELIDALFLYDEYGEPTSRDLWLHIRDYVEWVCKHWQEPDQGIWEVRSGRKEFLYSRVMCWVAVDRGLRLAEKRSLPAPTEKWRKVRDEIYQDIFEHFWSEKLQSFVGVKGSDDLDAACLIMPLVLFIAPTDPRWLSTLRAVEQALVDDSLVFRYNIHDMDTDGVGGKEGTFTICSFWYVECVSRSGDVQKARLLFEKILGYANHLGLCSEDIGPRGEHLGNFPQGLTHLGLISAAYDLNRRLSGAGWKA